jgi:hypothetical protein
LDQLDASMSSRMGGIKAVYQGTITLSANMSTQSAALGATVNLSKTLLFHLGTTAPSQGVDDAFVRLSLTSTSVTANRTGTSGITVVGYQVVEFN